MLPHKADTAILPVSRSVHRLIEDRRVTQTKIPDTVFLLQKSEDSRNTTGTDTASDSQEAKRNES